VAQVLLIKGKTVEQIAADLAFADKSAFTRAFKKWAGMPPARWARSAPPLRQRSWPHRSIGADRTARRRLCAERIACYRTLPAQRIRAV
jgi:hypothetical protein